jgi:hypothetical protein
MLVRIDDPDLVPELSVFLQNSGFEVLRSDQGQLQVTSADARLLAPALAVWNELHKDARAELEPA